MAADFPHLLLTHAGSLRVPWQLEGEVHEAASPYTAPEQSLALAQQSPPAQQWPFWQWAAVQSLFSSQEPPSPTLGWQVPSQW